ncbi:hypothetical protein DICPUDRAFT_159283 [Dictyostelium purpureum]|uniref:Uncharacterized protein n=1 Tax=Dictyostelium purpureum TaxID=5786 RepID=F1A3R1_DICPU|nr:uncharacterized protein DICPUDRAFT_159283 [Dictyostelium purpureum]EGC29170.1 hypothetical protein DICPUDRAFT_159283 [Dictyostelium purpureum]|eukprot:XP_003294305.1 hypothetical protein DICPUDRAFT_159283 [Dictyostelium purpureum]
MFQQSNYNSNSTPEFLVNQNNFMFFNNNANIPAPLPSNKTPYKNNSTNYINNNNYIDENNIINSLSNLININNNYNTNNYNNNNNNNNNNSNDFNVPTLSPQINNVDLYSSPVQTLNNTNNNNNNNNNNTQPIVTFPQYCSLKKCELCKRGQPPLLLKTPTWSSIMRVVFFTLHNEYPDKEYFSLKTEVYEFMTSHWERLCINRKRTDNWRKQIQDMLSHSKNVFESGLEKLKQNGFWKLRTIIDPWVINEKLDSSVNSSPSMSSNNSSPWRKKRNHEDIEESGNNNNNNTSGDKKLRCSNESVSQVPSSPLSDQSAPELESSLKEIDQIFSKEIQSIRCETKKFFKLLPTIKKDNEKLKSIQQTLSLFENRLNILEKEKENIKTSSPSLSYPSSPQNFCEPSSPLQQTPSSPSQPNSRATSPLPLQRITNPSNCTTNNNSNQKLFFI